MKRGVVYALGVVALVVVAVVALPVTGRMLEARLQDEIDAALADKGLTGIVAQVDGQSVRLAYTEDAAQAITVDDPGLLGPRMAWAVDAAAYLRGALYKAPGRGGLVWGPATHVEVDQPSIDRLAGELSARQKARAVVVAQARACTEDVARAVAERKLSFISGSFDLTPDSETILDDIYTVIAACPGHLVLHVEGHTDARGNDADNIALSGARAEAAAKGLITRGLTRSQVVSQGFGESRPIADNATPEGQAKNRRVMFVMTAPEGRAP